jgi:hypothetical protein
MDQFKEGVGKSATGHMYEVNVAADPEKFLHWDKPLSEQHPDVQKAIVPYVKKAMDLEYTSPGDPLSVTGEVALGAVRSLTDDFAKGGLGAAEAARLLKEAGVPGIRYLDQGSRRAGEGSMNAVVFDPATMEIIRRYGLAGLMGGGAAAAAQQQPNALVVP